MGLQDSLRTISSSPIKKGDPPQVAARSDLMNAMREAILSLARGENIGKGLGIRKRTSEGSFVLMVDSKRSFGGGTTGFTPFLVYPSVDNTDPPYPILKVYPGKIAGLIPTLEGAKLDVLDTDFGLHPWFYPPGTPFTFFLRCKIEVDADNLFRPSITEVKVLTDDDPLVVPDIEGSEVPELKIKWDDGDTHEKGHFYIKIADVDMTTVEGNIVFNDKTQWLYDSYSSFVASDTEAIPVI
jgi:hypothetical protein